MGPKDRKSRLSYPHCLHLKSYVGFLYQLNIRRFYHLFCIRPLFDLLVVVTYDLVCSNLSYLWLVVGSVVVMIVVSTVALVAVVEMVGTVEIGFDYVVVESSSFVCHFECYSSVEVAVETIETFGLVLYVGTVVTVDVRCCVAFVAQYMNQIFAVVFAGMFD